MATIGEARALPYFVDLYGKPLEGGKIYIGQAGLDPVAYPADVYDDTAQTTLLTQPIRTVHGIATSAGALVHLYCPVPYSISVLDSANRVVYASINENDPILTVIGNATVQSVANLAALRALDKNSTNQVWVNGFGMYVYVPSDTTSPESIPSIIVANDGGRYYLSQQYVAGKTVSASLPNTDTSADVVLSYGDESNGAAYLTVKPGALSGGLVVRMMDASGAVELARISLTAAGGIQSAADINSAKNLVAQTGLVGFGPGGNPSLSWNGSNFALSNGPLTIAGDRAMTIPYLISNQFAFGIGAYALGAGAGPTPSQPGTWTPTGFASNSVALYVRTA